MGKFTFLLASIVIASACGLISCQNKTSPGDDFLINLNGTFNSTVSWYTNTQLDSIKYLDSGSLNTQNSEWTCKITSEQAVKPLGYTAFLNWPKVKLKSG